jgi:hypothetical protein
MPAAKSHKRMSALMEELSPKKTFWERYSTPLSIIGVGTLCSLLTAGIMGLYMLKNTLTPSQQPEPTSLTAIIQSTQTPATPDPCNNPNYNCGPTTWDFKIQDAPFFLSVSDQKVTGYAEPDRLLEIRYSLIKGQTNPACDPAGSFIFEISGPGLDQSLPNAKNDSFTISGHESYTLLINTAGGGNYSITLKNHMAYGCGPIEASLFLSEGIWEYK